MFTRFIIKLAHIVSGKNPRRFFYIFFTFTIFLFLPLIIVVSSFTRINQNLTELYLSRAQNIAPPIALALTDRIDRLVDGGRGISIHPKIRELVLEDKWNEALEVVKIFNYVTDDPFIDRVALLDPAGTLQVALPESGTEGQNFSHRDWYQGMIASGKPYISEIYTRAVQPQYNVVSASFPIVDQDNILIAILVLQIKQDNFLEWTEKLKTISGEVVYVVDQKGNIVAHSEITQVLGEPIVNLSEFPIIKKIREGGRGQEISFDPMDPTDQVVSMYEPIPRYGWGIVVQRPIDLVFGPRDQYSKLLVFFYGAIFLINVFLIYLVIRILTHYKDHGDFIISPKQK